MAYKGIKIGELFYDSFNDRYLQPDGIGSDLKWRCIVRQGNIDGDYELVGEVFLTEGDLRQYKKCKGGCSL